MKNLKIVFASLLLVVGVVALSSFASDSFKENAFETVCYKYIGPNDDESDPTRPTPADIANTSNWVISTQAAVLSDCTEVPYLCGICFDDEELDLEEAIGILADVVAADDNDNFYDVITTNGQVVGTAPDVVTVYLDENPLP